MKTPLPLIAAVLACSIFMGPLHAAHTPSPTPTPTPMSPPVPPEIVAMHDKLSALLSPAAHVWVVEEAGKASRNTKITEANIRADIQNRFTGQSMANLDKNILLFVVLTEAAQDMGADLDAIAADLIKKNAQKQAADPAPGKAGNTNISVPMEEMASLQEAVERRTQFIASISALQKKIPGTDGAIVGNLK